MRGLVPMLVAFSTAKVLVLVGLAVAVVGVVLTIAGFSVLWLAWAGAVTAGVSFASVYFIGQKLHSSLERSPQAPVTVYMPLLNEATDVWRPVEAIKIDDLGYMVTGPAPEGEEWAFTPGQILRCENRKLSGKTVLVAVAKAM